MRKKPPVAPRKPAKPRDFETIAREQLEKYDGALRELAHENSLRKPQKKPPGA